MCLFIKGLSIIRSSFESIIPLVRLIFGKLQEAHFEFQVLEDNPFQVYKSRYSGVVRRGQFMIIIILMVKNLY